MSELFDKLKAAVGPRYELENELGSGGMATVYLALDGTHQRRVALKVLHPRLAGAVGHDRFLQEIRFAAELAHPHILPLLDSGTVTIDGRTLPYYVMPFVEGESLRARLQRQKQLPIEEAVAIARDVAAALTYAHAHRVVHRDIKPENILLAGNEAVVADFGIARAINRAAESEVITTEGMAVGTPAYMSPEQSLAAHEIDGRSDIYSLGCVLYEMLGGEPPFTGSTPQAIVARHQIDPVPSLTTLRPTVPVALELIVKKTLQKQAADRFQSAAELVAALNSGISGAVPAAGAAISRTKERFRAVLLVLALVAAGTVVAILNYDGGNNDGDTALDTTLFAVIPARSDASPSALDPSLLLQDALARWSGISLVEPFQVRSAASRGGDDDFRHIARSFGAGRYIRVNVSTLPDSLRVQASLYETGDNRKLADGTVHLAGDNSNTAAAIGALAERLLFRSDNPRGRLEWAGGTTSLPARQAFVRGYAAVEKWDLLAADSAFDGATRYDSEYAEASLWLALIRLWSGEDLEIWQSAAERAAAGRARLAPRDQLISDAVLAQARHDVARSCAVWQRLTRDHPQDFIAWFGSADCQSGDSTVVRDPRSPSRWRFRTSYHSALQAYQQAFRLLPSIHLALRTGSFEGVRRLFKTSGNDLRTGRAALPDTGSFIAYPTWQGDSLAFIPFPAARITEARRRSVSVTEAIQHQRDLFHKVARSWVVAFPRSSAALEALGLSLEMIGSASALDTVRRARQLATSEDEALRLAASEVWLTIKFSIPDDTLGIRRAQVLAESLLTSPTARRTSRPRLLAGLALLVGRGSIAVELSRGPGFKEDWSTVPALTAIAPPMLVYAAMGGPPDSLAILEERFQRALENSVPASRHLNERLRWLARSASLAFPEFVFRSIPSLVGQQDYLIDAMAASLSGDTATVRKILLDLQVTRQRIRPADRAFEALLPEARLWMALGEDSIAIAWLEPTLAALSGIGPSVLEDPVIAGALVRALALRSDLARRTGDQSGSRLWATPVAILHQHAEENHPYLVTTRQHTN